ncbi:MAG: hypothetical protein JW844_04730 [Candidatus Omnitrophica bacterium]|nr:hypothetical protein [Candidatus Omnitrophota bacterium]
MKTLQQIKSDFEQILSEVLRINGISVESAVQVSTVILQESGKYNRCPEIKTENEDEFVFATESQKKAMRNLRISFPEEIGKTEASQLIESAVTKLRSNGNGRAIPARSPFQK